MNGYLYLLVHPDKPEYIKIGRTTRHPVQRLVEHNKHGECGEIAKATGKPWELIHYVPVTNTRKAEIGFFEYLGRAANGRSELFRLGNQIGTVLIDLTYGVNIEEYFYERRYKEMLQTELRDYDVYEFLESVRAKRQLFESLGITRPYIR